jgi:hypothetical protein
VVFEMGRKKILIKGVAAVRTKRSRNKSITSVDS